MNKLGKNIWNYVDIILNNNLFDSIEKSSGRKIENKLWHELRDHLKRNPIDDLESDIDTSLISIINSE